MQSEIFRIFNPIFRQYSNNTDEREKLIKIFGNVYCSTLELSNKPKKIVCNQKIIKLSYTGLQLVQTQLSLPHFFVYAVNLNSTYCFRVVLLELVFYLEKDTMDLET